MTPFEKTFVDTLVEYLGEDIRAYTEDTRFVQCIKKGETDPTIGREAWMYLETEYTTFIDYEDADGKNVRNDPGGLTDVLIPELLKLSLTMEMETFLGAGLRERFEK